MYLDCKLFYFNRRKNVHNLIAMVNMFMVILTTLHFCCRIDIYLYMRINIIIKK